VCRSKNSQDIQKSKATGGNRTRNPVLSVSENHRRIAVFTLSHNFKKAASTARTGWPRAEHHKEVSDKPTRTKSACQFAPIRVVSARSISSNLTESGGSKPCPLPAEDSLRPGCQSQDTTYKIFLPLSTLFFTLGRFSGHSTGLAIWSKLTPSATCKKGVTSGEGEYNDCSHAPTF